jgi:hypothetical protein
MFLGHKDPEPLVRGMDPDPSISVVDPYSFFTDPDPEFAVGDQYGSGSRIRIHNTAIYH